MFSLLIRRDLFVRSLMESDLNDLLDLLVRNRNDAGKFVQLDTATDTKSLRNRLREYDEAFTAGRGLFLGVFLDTHLCGEIRFEVESDAKSSESCGCNIAYWLDVDSRGNRLIYDCLKAMLPVVNRMQWLNGKRISHFEAMIERTNSASQKIIQRLGFEQRISLKDPLDILLDEIAPRTVVEWILATNRLEEDPVFFETSNMSYMLEISTNSWHDESESDKQARISLLVSLLDALSNSETIEPLDFASYSTLLELQRSLCELVGKLAPERVVSTDIITSCCPINLDQFSGLWRDPESTDTLIIVHDNYCVKGYVQSWDMCQIAGLSVSEILESKMMLVDGGTSQAWERVSLGKRNQVDGIWKTSRGYVGVHGAQCISCSSLWEIRSESGSGRWTLAMGSQWLFHIDSISSNEIVWCTTTESTILKRSARKRHNTGPMRWVRESVSDESALLSSFVSSFTWSLRNREINRCIVLRRIEIAIILKCGNPDRKLLKRFKQLEISDRQLDRLFEERECLVKELAEMSHSKEFWNDISNNLIQLPLCHWPERISTKLESELDN